MKATAITTRISPIYRRMQLGYVDWKDAYKRAWGFSEEDQHFGTVSPDYKKRGKLLEAIIPNFAIGDNVSVIMYPNTLNWREELKGTVVGYKTYKPKGLKTGPVFVLGLRQEGKQRATYIHIDPFMYSEGDNIQNLNIESALTTKTRENPVEALLVRSDGFVFFQIVNNSHRFLPKDRKKYLEV